MYRNRVWHLGSTGCCSSAGSHCFPPSVLTSTLVIRPRPLHAIPLISHQPRSRRITGYAGNVMIDFASMTKLNMRAVPSPNGSVYFDVSSRVMNGRSAKRRRSTRSEEHTSELQSRLHLVCRLLLEKKKITNTKLQCI